MSIDIEPMIRTCALVMLAACGARAPASNHMLTSVVALEIVKPPHVAILVSNDLGLHRLHLGTGKSEKLDEGATVAIDLATWIRIDGDRYVIAHEKERILVRGVEPVHDVKISHDRKRFAVVQGDAEIAIVAIADGSVQKVPLVRRTARERYSGITIAWVKGDTALSVADGVEQYRIDLATGARSPTDSLDLQANAAVSNNECGARGLRLELRVRDKQQQVVLVPLASTANPEEVTSTTDRVLVAATNHPIPSPRHGAMHMSNKRLPGELHLAGFTPACDHFVFELEGRVYLGNTKTGQFAFMMRGRPVFVR